MHRNSSEEKKKIHTELEIEKYCRIEVSFQNSGDNLTLLKPYTVTQSLEVFEKLQS
jgi:hypothetical protein